ncbi:MAG: tripartite tricarboxylate transporter substrate binding protein [Burkholderiales bacterium]
MKSIIFRAAFAGALVSGPALAADTPPYPSKPVRLIAPSSPGSGVDIVSRLVAQKLGASLGQQVVVENRAGAGGNLGAEIAARAAPDGYTLFMATPSHAINPALYRKLNYDTLRDFTPIALVMTGQYVLVVHPSLPAKSVKEFVALAKARPGQLNYASAGNGNATHLAGELLKSLAKIDIVHVAYKGSGPALVDLISGQVHFMFPNLVNSLSHIAAGRLRALAVTGAKRATAAPDIPTLIEAGVAGYTVASWYGMLAPAGTPQAVVGRLNGELVKVLRSPDVKERLAAQGADPAGGAPEEFLVFLKEEIVKWGKVVKGAGISAE